MNHPNQRVESVSMKNLNFLVKLENMDETLKHNCIKWHQLDKLNYISCESSAGRKIKCYNLKALYILILKFDNYFFLVTSTVKYRLFIVSHLYWSCHHNHWTCITCYLLEIKYV